MKFVNRVTAFCLTLVVAASLCSCKKDETTQTSTGWSKKLELTVWETNGTDYAMKEQPNENVVGDWLEKKTNVTVKNMYGNGGGQWDTKLTKLVAGGNLPDVVHCGAGQGPSHYATLDQMGKVWELTPELLMEYAPEVWKRVPQELWDKMTVNGKILGIPYYIAANEESQPYATKEDLAFYNESKLIPANDVMYTKSQCLWIRDDILKMFFPEAKTYDELAAILEERKEPIGDELLDIPIDSTEEFIQFMYDIRDLNLKENGNKVYAFGYDGGDNWSALCWLGADMYGYKGHYYTSAWNDVKQEIEVPLTGEMIRTAAKTQNKMVNDGVIDMESLAHTYALYTQKVMNGQYAIVPIDLVGNADSINRQLEEQGKSYRFRPFITQVPAQEGYGAYQQKYDWEQSVCFLKTLSEEELKQVLNWVNVQFTDEYEEILNWGPPEAGLYKEENGVRSFVDERFNRYFIEDDATALDAKETKGLGGVNKHAENGLLSFRVSRYSRWTPSILLRKNPLLPTTASGFKFKQDSPHVQNVKSYPPCQVWDSVYAEIPEIVEFWAKREQWESEFKLALAAAEGEFDAKWQKAVDKTNSIADTKVMAEKMTEIAKSLLN